MKEGKIVLDSLIRMTKVAGAVSIVMMIIPAMVVPTFAANSPAASGFEAKAVDEWVLPVGERTLKDPAQDLPEIQLAATFKLPKTGPSQREARAAELPKELKFAYAYGSDSELTYRRNDDLDNRLKDEYVWFAPTLFAFVDYRPNAWLATRLEGTLERIFDIQQQDPTILPDGRSVPAEVFRTSVLIDQAYVNIKSITDPFEITVGRRAFEDARLWLYDAALDGVIVKHKMENLHTEFSVTREDLLDLDLLVNVPKGRIDNYMVYSEYRGIEDHKIAGYVIKRIDQEKPSQEGRPLLLGARAYGRPTDAFNYWAELGFVRGTDQFAQDLSGYAFEVGGTYRFLDLPLQPNFTLGYAYGSGDGNPDDNKNEEFRQTGLQSNEARFGGLTQFKAYGEMIDPELSNLKKFTAGFGFRPAANAFVDVVYHKFNTIHIAEQLRNWSLTAEMNQDPLRQSNDVGQEIDVIVGFRNLFGLRRFGFEARAGWFFPGRAFRNDVSGDPFNPSGVYQKADKGFSLLAVFIW